MLRIIGSRNCTSHLYRMVQLSWQGSGKKTSCRKGHTFEECQARARATGNKWMGTNGRHFSNPTSPTAKGFMAQCMRGEV